MIWDNGTPSSVCEKEEEGEKTKTGIISPPSLPPDSYCCCSIGQQQQQQLQQLLFSDWIREGGKKGCMDHHITSRRHPWSCNQCGIMEYLLQMPFFPLCIAACMMHGCCYSARLYIAKAKRKNKEEKRKVILSFIHAEYAVCELSSHVLLPY